MLVCSALSGRESKEPWLRKKDGVFWILINRVVFFFSQLGDVKPKGPTGNLMYLECRVKKKRQTLQKKVWGGGVVCFLQ